MKLEVGKQYKTRGGWRAVVVDTYKDGFKVWHSKDNMIGQNHITGNVFGAMDNLPADLVEEWQEPEVIEGWVEIYGANIEEIDADFYHNRANLENGLKNTEESSRAKTFAVKRIKFTVGERDDEDLHQLRSDLLIHGACLHRVDKEGKIKRIDPKDWERDDLDETWNQ